MVTANSEENQGCIMKKIKLNEGTSDFMLTGYTTIPRSKLAYEKFTPTLVVSWWPGNAFRILMILCTLQQEQIV